MIEYRNLTLIGTSHISPESVKLVKKVIGEKQPDFVALELDKGRLKALLEKNRRKIRIRDIRKLGIKGFLFTLFGSWMEEKLGKVVKTKPGSEMKAAVISAAKNNAKVVLIDQDISITIKRLFKTITWKEKWCFVWDIISSPFAKKQVVEFDLRKVPSQKVIEKMVQKVRKRYPSLYKVLIEERNVIMGKRLSKLMEKQPDKKIVAVVGAGHEKAIIELIKANVSS